VEFSTREERDDELNEVRTIFAVDSAHELVDFALELAVLLDVLTRGHGHLDQHDLAHPLGETLKELLQALQLLGDALDVVQAINTHDHLLISVRLLHLLHALPVIVRQHSRGCKGQQIDRRAYRTGASSMLSKNF
jgi:hypothetical protein